MSSRSAEEKWDVNEELERFMSGTKSRSKRRQLVKDQKFENERFLKHAKAGERQERKRRQMEKLLTTNSLEKKHEAAQQRRQRANRSLLQNKALPSVEQALSCHRETLRMMREDKNTNVEELDERIRIFEMNYQMWQSRRAQAMLDAEQADAMVREGIQLEEKIKADKKARRNHEKLLALVLDEMFPGRPSVENLPSRAKAVTPREEARKPRTLMGYFAPAPDRNVKRCMRTWDRTFIELVIPATRSLNEQDWPTEDDTFLSEQMRANQRREFHSPIETDDPNMPLITGAQAAAARANHRDIMREQMCKSCNIPMLINTKIGALVCKECGVVKEHVYGIGMHTSFDSKLSSSRTGMPYSRVSHFCDLLVRLQGIETCHIPEIVIQSLLKQLRLLGVNPTEDPQLLTHTYIRKLLKMCGHQRYYENASQIRTRLTGLRMPRLTQEESDELVRRFEQIEQPFRAVRKMYKRRNMISYRYVCFKLMQLMGKHEWLPYIVLLETTSHLVAVDQVWKAICKKLGWKAMATPLA